MKLRLIFPGAMSFVPIVGYGLLMSFAAMAYFKMGQWPILHRPDPKDVGPLFVGEFVTMTVLVFAYVFSPIAFAVMCWTGARRALDGSTGSEKQKRALALVCQLCVFALGAYLFRTELTRLQDWLID